MFALLLVAVSLTDPSVIRDHFDLLEVNHYYNDQGQPVFVQLILWNWHKGEQRFISQGYVMLKGAIVKTPEGKQKWDAEIEKWTKKLPLQVRMEIASSHKYAGHYVHHPAHPERKWKQRVWVSRLNEGGIQREIISKIFRETWTRYDPEVWDRDQNPYFERRGLSKP
jgi:hypothetical protein